jgi:hypothetical protein
MHSACHSENNEMLAIHSEEEYMIVGEREGHSDAGDGPHLSQEPDH